jgi:chitinase
MRSQLPRAGTLSIRHHHVGAAVVVVALLAVIQGAAGSRSSFMARSLLQDGSCSSSSPCPDPSDCCSEWGYCGTTSDYCGQGCQNGPCTGSGGGTCSSSSPCPNPSDCCSEWGYCGTTTDYCGQGCQNGPCTTGWASFFPQSVFEGWFPNRLQNFYTYGAFTAAASAFPAFGTTGSLDDQKREIAAFFGNVQQESGGLQYVNEIDGASYDYCDESNTQYPCAPGENYYGRGPLQLSWNYNYGLCGQDLGLNLLANPDQVAQDGTVAFKTAIWFWMKRNCHGAIIGPPPSFAQTIRIINGGIECGHGFDQRVENRVNAYTNFCSSLGVNPGTDLRC